MIFNLLSRDRKFLFRMYRVSNQSEQQKPDQLQVQDWLGTDRQLRSQGNAADGNLRGGRHLQGGRTNAPA